jgi:hypothetical protein
LNSSQTSPAVLIVSLSFWRIWIPRSVVGFECGTTKDERRNRVLTHCSVKIDGIPVPSEGRNSTIYLWVADWAYGRRDSYGPMVQCIRVDPVAAEELPVRCSRIYLWVADWAHGKRAASSVTYAVIYGDPTWLSCRLLRHQTIGRSRCLASC